MRRSFLAAVVTTLCLALAGTADAQSRWAEPYRQGMDAVKAGRYEEGIPLLERAIAIDRRQARVKLIEGTFTIEYYPYYYLGVAYLRIGNLEKAEEAFTNAKSCRCLTSDLQGLLNKYEGDLRTLKEARNKPKPTPAPPTGGTDPNFLRQLGEADSAMGSRRYADALQLFETLRGMDPAEFNKRNLAARRDDAARAVAAELVRQGDDLLKAGQLTGARAKYEEANGVLPGSGQRGLDEVLGRQNQYAKLKGGADADARANRAEAALEKLKLAESADPEQYRRDGLDARVRELTRQLQGSSASQKVADLIRRAQERAAAHDYRAAVGFYGQALNADPNNAEAKSWLQANAEFERLSDSGKRLYDAGQLAPAREAFENARLQSEERFAFEKLNELVDAINKKLLAGVPEEQLAQVLEGIVAYLRGDSAQARTRLEAMAAREASLDARVRSHVFAWLGATYADLSIAARADAERAELRAKALERFRQLLAAEPGYQLRDSLISPRVREMLEEVRGKR